MFSRKKALIFFWLGWVLTALILIFPPQPRFNYDFEQFFPTDDENLSFYQDYESKFGSDNDYVLVAISNPAGDWQDSAFLEKSYRAQNSIQEIEGIDTIISILDLKLPLISPFGLRFEKVLDWKSPQNLQTSEPKLEQFQSSLISKDGDSFLFLIKNSPQLTKEEGDKVYQQIQHVFAENDLIPKALAGKIQTQKDFVELMQAEFGIFLGISFLLILVMLLLVFRSFWGVGIPILVLCIAILWAFAMILYSGKALDIMSVMQPTLFLIVGLSALVHYFTHLIQNLRKNIPQEEAVRQTFTQLTPAVALTMVTTSFGFISLYFTSIPALKEFGLGTGLGIFVVFLAILLFTPGFCYLFSIKISGSQSKSIPISIFHTWFSWILKSKRTIVSGFLLVSILCIWASSQLKINGFLLDNLPLSHPIQQDFKYFDAQFGGSNPLELALEVGPKASNLLDRKVLESLDKLEKKIQEVFENGELISPLSLVKTLNQAQNQGNPKAFSLPSLGQYQRMTRFFGQLDRLGGNQVISQDLKSGRISGRTADFGSYEMGFKRQEIIDFAEKELDPELVKVKWTGTGYLIDQGHESVTWQLAKGLGVAFLLVGLIAGILFKSWRISFILLIPNMIPLLWMLGMMALLGIDFKLTTAILFTVAFGIAVDDTIHFMAKLKSELSQSKDFIYAIKRTFLEAGRAIFLTSLILVAGFSVLIFSQFGVVHFTGLLISFSLIFAWLADVFLLPVLLFPLKKVWQSKIKISKINSSHPK
ncbi:hypothetical protein DFQ04_1481 [Algoriphagus boseongensis]|uniref:SSD domain-containing protein n=1 Tax=Algoriphagus boseongensis TaxID=1442587 RepID=A0A4V3D2N8_9BACT|nr:MMPL family transporter [Algoriphagus boseongensis]TDQ19657.1 hypothetical protein DFQ04_1481 [Algoriphagus boseongensis]